jgi:hypothetical protein
MDKNDRGPHNMFITAIFWMLDLQNQPSPKKTISTIFYTNNMRLVFIKT